VTENWINKIFKLHDEDSFISLALELFRYQAEHVPVYRSFINYLGCRPEKVSCVEDIPFMPIGFFSRHSIVAKEGKAPLVFLSSGTTSSTRSRHEVLRPDLYIKSFTKGFNHFYGRPEQYCILGLLPSYLEQGDSSLVFMVDNLIRAGKHPLSGFYLKQDEALKQSLETLKSSAQPTILIGVSYALFDLAESFHIGFPELIVMETGGMKGRRREMIRTELHQFLCHGLGVQQIHSEYGMTELLSQAYSKKDGLFKTPPWMRVIVRDMDDPLSLAPIGRTGGINVVDLANVFSCAFIATQDLGKVAPDGSFEVLGRFDNSDARGCNLMVV
jgi:hypothetical protein